MESQDQTKTTTENKIHDINDLNALYTDADSTDKTCFAEQRSYVLLSSGDHYNKIYNSFFRRIRDTSQLNQEQKLRLTKNHIQKIVKGYANNIISMAPGVGFEPANEQEMQDQKAAELHHAVWQWANEQYGIESELVDDWCDSYCTIGEVAVKIFFDPSMGSILHYQQKLDDQGQPMNHPLTGQPLPDESLPVREGGFVFEEIYGFNLLRPVECKVMRDAAWLGDRKMADVKVLKEKYKDQPDKLKFIQASNDETYVIFDTAYGGYRKAKDQVMIRSYFFKSCSQYPNGQFFITTKEGILENGALPGGIFPIIFQAFDKVPTTPRGRSIIKVIKPYQAEINRAGSKIAEHQITLGDDKLLIQNGTKISAGVALPGVRSVSYTGMEPGILPGRDGSQYLAYMQAQIAEMYEVANMAEDAVENPQNMDPYMMLFQSASKKKKFQRYIKRFENFLTQVTKTFLQLAKIHMPDGMLIYAIGKPEQVNIPEFRNMSDLCYQIKVVPQSDDVETKLGKQVVMNHIIQYVGSQLKPEDIGKIMRQMPYVNADSSFDDMTIDYDSSVNDILALDRGEIPPVHIYDDHVYASKRLVARMRQADFKYLSPQIQQNYANAVSMHNQAESQNQLQIQRAEQGYIPTDGALITCNMYVPDASGDPKKVSKLVRIPYSALQWLIKHLETQGQSLQSLEDMQTGQQAQIASTMQGNQQNVVPMNQGSNQGAY